MIEALGFSPDKVAGCGCCSRLAFIWVLTGGTEFVFGAAGDGLHSGREVWVHKIPLCACRSDETLTDSFTDYTNIMLPSVILLPQLSLKIF